MQSTTIYLEPRQMKELKKRARENETTFSEEVRGAINSYLARTSEAFSEQEMDALMKQVNSSMKNITRMLGEANAKIERILPLVRKDLEKK